MRWSTYVRYEVLRNFRNWRFLVFSLGFPLILLLVVGGPNRHSRLGGVPFLLYYMTGMATFGTMTAVVSGGARIADERKSGWTRQMRITPLSVGTYFGAKVLTSYLMAIASMAVLFLTGRALGVQLAAVDWLIMTGLLLVGLIPFAVFGIFLGHVLDVDSLGPALGGSVTVLALLGGAWGPLVRGGALQEVIKVLPSYWLVRAADTALHGSGWSLEGWLVIVVWSVAVTRLAVFAYRRDTARV